MSNALNAAPISRAETHALVLLLLAQVVLFLIPLIVLGQAIGWPASLRLPAAEALPLIARNANAVQIGYWGYLLTATAMIPLVLALHRHARRRVFPACCRMPWLPSASQQRPENAGHRPVADRHAHPGASPWCDIRSGPAPGAGKSAISR